MAIAVGMVQVLGYPAALQVADVMVKAANVRVVSCEGIGDGYWSVVIRGSVSDVQVAVKAGRSALEGVPGHSVISQQVIAQPGNELEQILPICYPHPSMDDFLL